MNDTVTLTVPASHIVSRLHMEGQRKCHNTLIYLKNIVTVTTKVKTYLTHIFKPAVAHRQMQPMSSELCK